MQGFSQILISALNRINIYTLLFCLLIELRARFFVTPSWMFYTIWPVLFFCQSFEFSPRSLRWRCVKSSRPKKKPEMWHKKYTFRFKHARKGSKNKRHFHFVSWLLFLLLVRSFFRLLSHLALDFCFLAVYKSHQAWSILYGNHFDVILFV